MKGFTMKHIVAVLAVFLIGMAYLAYTLIGKSPAAVKPPVSATVAGVSAEEAYKIAKEAYIFSFPLNYYYRTVYSQVIDPANRKGLGGFGEWRHDGLATPADKDATLPNNDTTYSWAWVDVRSEPWVLIQPPADANRFYSSVWGDLWGHIIDSPGSVTDGQKGGVYLLAASSWQGTVPKGIKRVIRGDTTILGTLARTAVFGALDLQNMEKIQQSYKLMPLSSYLKKPAPPAAPQPNWPAWNENSMSNADFFKLTNFLLQFVSPNEKDKPMYEQMAKLGIGPKGHYDPTQFSPEILAAINKGILEGRKAIMDGAAKTGVTPRLYGNRDFMGTRYLDLAIGVEAGGVFPNLAKQAAFEQWTQDAKGDRLDGSKAKYTFTFPKGQLPPVRFFWSMTAYDLNTRMLVENPKNRYSIGNRNKGLKFNADGSLTVYVQKDSPGADKESNWLPAPNGPIVIISRMYGPDASIQNGTYKFPDPIKVQ